MNLLFGFQGRISRLPFWLIKLMLIVLNGVVHAAIFASIGRARLASVTSHQDFWREVGAVNGMVLVVLAIVTLWVALAAGVKRFHDRDKPGWWVLIFLVPVIGELWYVIECGFLAGTAGPNRYGPDPLTRLA